MAVKCGVRALATRFLLGAILLGANAAADVVAIGPDAFPTGSTVLNFNGLATGTEVNGLINNGVLFTYTVGGIPLNGAVEIDGGPGVTNNISPPNIVSIGNDTGTLTMTLPSDENLFGYGYAILNIGPVANATTISLFEGTTSVGTLSYNGVPDPTFTGGFAGIASTVAFNKVEVTFNSAAAPAFALDNVTFATSTVPEPSTFLVGIFLGAVVLYRRRHHRKPYLL